MEPLIFVTRRPPWPLDNGSRIRGLRLLQGLSRRFDATLVTFGDGPSYDTSTASREDLERELPDAAVEFVPYGRPMPRGARWNVLRRRSDTFGHYDTPTLRAALRRLGAGRPGVLVHLDDVGAGLAGIGVGAKPAIFAPHNIEHRIIADLARRMPWDHRPFLALEARKLAAEERRLWRAADLCVAVSEIDAATMRAAGAARVEICPNGSDPRDPLPLPPLGPGEPVRLLFVGSLRFWPYMHAMSWFVRSALPVVREAAGPVRVDAVGDHDEGAATADEVVYHGRVPDVLPFYERAHALVLPVFEGSGTRLKVVEAALFNRPIISTRLGAEGLPLSEGHEFLAAEDEAGFAAAVAQLRRELETDDPALPARCESARRAVADLTWPRIADRLGDLYEAELQMTSER